MKVNSDKLIYFCDNKRHLVCLPYNIPNLHRMAKELSISRWWFHKGKDGKSHYDIPKRRIEEITKKCEVISSKDILRIIKGIKIE